MISRGVLLRVLMVLSGIIAGLLVTEILLRWVNPRPPTQIIRSEKVAFGITISDDGTPVWKLSRDQEHFDCATRYPERTRIMVFGDSIAFGSGAEPDPAFPAILEERLNAHHPVPGYCVMNFAVPGFGFDQSWSVARREIPRWKPRLVLWEIWGEGSRYVMLGDAAFSLGRYALSPSGFPWLPLVPDALNRALFLHFRLYQFAALTWGADGDRSPTARRSATPWIRDHYLRLTELVQTEGTRLAIFFATGLARPFKESRWTSQPSWMWDDVYNLFEPQGVSVYDLASELADQDYTVVRADECCHFNAVGHRVLAERFESIVMNELARSSPHSRADPPINKVSAAAGSSAPR